ncbi:MAG: ribonuclease HII [Bacteroidetes bacterium]|nr:ribonuclease HII [bacterium]NBP66052.1 ribonuclease HII [Bacteroidota bacterium]
MLEVPGINEVGIDESGRGTLFGSVIAAAVVLPTTIEPWMEKLNDSKKLSEKQRKILAKEIMANAIAWGVGETTAEEIDDTNILRASILAMHRALDSLSNPITINKIYIDGNYFLPYEGINYKCIVGGDGKRMDIAAASILAKVFRDNQMIEMCKSDTELIKYGIEKNKGYGTKVHMDAIKEYGAHKYHRKTFAPICNK